MLDVKGLHLRAGFFRIIRSFFHQQGFLEVDTPIRQPVYIPESNIVPIEAEGQFLQTSPELCMKRLLAAGCDNIFQICHCFRKGEIGRLHLEEFQMLEWYRTGADYLQLMEDCQSLLRFLQDELNSMEDEWCITKRPFFSGVSIEDTWERITVEEAFNNFSPIKLDRALLEEKFDQLLVEHIEPNLGFGVPLILYDYPVELGSLARKKPNDPTLAERFELYINGVELANGFSELTDIEEQRKRFQTEIAAIASCGGDSVGMPEQFLTELRHLDEAAGIALGLDRLFMIAVSCGELSGAVSFSPDDYL